MCKGVTSSLHGLCQCYMSKVRSDSKFTLVTKTFILTNLFGFYLSMGWDLFYLHPNAVEVNRTYFVVLIEKNKKHKTRHVLKDAVPRPHCGRGHKR